MPSAEPKGKGEYGDCLGCDEDPSPLMSMMRSTELLTKKMIQLLYSSILSNCNKNFPCGSSTLRGQNSWWPSRPKHVSKMAKIPMAIFFSSHLVQIWLKVTSVFSDNCSNFEFSRQHFLNDVVELMDQCKEKDNKFRNTFQDLSQKLHKVPKSGSFAEKNICYWERYAQ